MEKQKKNSVKYLTSSFVIMAFSYFLNELLVPGFSLAVGILSDTSFSSLEGKVSDLTLKATKEMGFEKMTEIQVTVRDV